MIVISTYLVAVLSLSSFKDASGLYSRVSPSVVTIETNLSSGTGFFVRGGKYVVTCFHVIRNSSYILIEKKGVRCTGVAFADPAADIAVLSVSGGTQRSLSVKTTLPRSGSAVFAIGSALGILNNTISDGIVSGTRRVRQDVMIQFTAPVSPGMSGGPLVDSSGIVVGMIAAGIDEGQNLNFAVSGKTISQSIARAEAALRRKPPVVKQTNTPQIRSTRSSGGSPRGPKPNGTLRVIGKLGQVVSASPIHAEMDSGSLVYSMTSDFQYLVVNTTSSDKWLAVKLVNGKSGYILSENVAILPYEVTVPENGQPVAQDLPAFDLTTTQGKVGSAAFGNLGRPYVAKGTRLESGVSNASFVRIIFETCQAGVLPETVKEQMEVGTEVSRLEDMKLGDRLFFSGVVTKEMETGIFLGYGSFGDARFVICSLERGKVILGDLRDPKWQSRFIGARRSFDSI